MLDIEHLYYETLSEQEKLAYTLLLRGMQTRQSLVTVPRKEASSLEKLFKALKFEHPELYYVDLYAGRVRRSALFEEYSVVYRYSEAEVREKDRQIEAAVQSILRDTGGVSEFAREMILHDRIVRNVTYGETEGAEYKAHSIEGVFLDRLAVCEGISQAFTFLCRRVSIPCTMVVGDLLIGKSYEQKKYNGHAWNLARIEGHTYYLDVTNDNYRYGYLSHTYFNLSDALISTTHRLPTDIRLPKCDFVYTPCPLINTWEDVVSALKEGCAKKQAAVEMRISRRFLRVSEVKEHLYEHLGDASCREVRKYLKSFISEEKAHVFTVLFAYP